MNVQINSIQFNVEPGTPSVRLRDVTLPEWRLGETSRHDQSKVGYSIRQAQNSPVFVRVRLTGPAGRTVRIRALIPETQVRSGCLVVLLPWLVPRRDWPSLHVLGAIAPFEVRFPPVPDPQRTDAKFARTEAEAVIELRNHTLGRDGIWISNSTWQWEEQIEGGPGPDRWQAIITSKHRVYCLFDHPKFPWSQDPADVSKLPSAHALDYACSVAMSGRSPEEVLRKLIQEIWEAGLHRRLSYQPDAREFGGSGDLFHLTEFINHMQSGTTNRNVDCYDTATALSLLANLLGLETIRRELALGGDIDPVPPLLWLIGQSELRSTISWITHACVGHSGTCWDACLQFNYERNPDARPDLHPVYGFSTPDYKRRLAGDTVAPRIVFQPLYQIPFD